MDDYEDLEDGIPAGEIQEVLAELGLHLSLEQAAEVAGLLESVGDVEEAIAALDELMGDFEEIPFDHEHRDAA